MIEEEIKIGLGKGQELIDGKKGKYNSRQRDVENSSSRCRDVEIELSYNIL